MKTTIKRPTIDDLEQKTVIINKEVYLKLHNYMLKENIELYRYLENKNELEDFLVSRANSADKAYNAGMIANYPNPEELRNEVLFVGIENSVSEYVESLLLELPDFKKKLDSSSRLNEIMNDLIINSLPIFYSMITIPYSTSQELLDNKLLRLLKQMSKTYSFDEIRKSKTTVKTCDFQFTEKIHYPEKIEKCEFEETYIPF
jgi:hypothetical protein